MGARRYLHTVLQSECTGCGLCVEPCPTDCIRLVPRIAPSSPQPDDLVQGTGSGLPDRETRAQLRERYKRHQTRFPEASAVVHARLTDAARLGEIQSIVHKRRARTTGATRPPSS